MIIEYNVYINTEIQAHLMYILQYIKLNFQKLFWEVNILYGFFC